MLLSEHPRLDAPAPPPSFQSLVPGISIALDECGTDMDNVLTEGSNPPQDNPLYWVAAGSYFAYLWSKVGVDASVSSINVRLLSTLTPQVVVMGDAVSVVAQVWRRVGRRRDSLFPAPLPTAISLAESIHGRPRPGEACEFFTTCNF